MNRRSLLGSILLAVAARPLTWSRSIGAALADDKNWRHGVSLFGDLKYPAGFRHFDYVNADAPKGGTIPPLITSTGWSPAACGMWNFRRISPQFRIRLVKLSDEQWLGTSGRS
jgi:hypothetical protein